MPKNVEIKARVRDFADVTERAERLSGSEGELILQEDTFFTVPNGRLKLRVFGPTSGELIFYLRDDAEGPKESSYVISKTNDPASLSAALSGALGTRGVVRKRRMLYMVGYTRIHIDEVFGLGQFLELEYVEPFDAAPGDGVAVTRDLMSALGVEEDDLVSGAYIDLLGA